jgi:hypothetical protein
VKELRDKFGVFGSDNCIASGVSMLFDVLNGWILDARFGPSKMNERKECLSHIDFLIKYLPHIAKQALLLLDRGYPSKKMFIELIEKGIHFVIKCPSTSLAAIRKASIGSTIITVEEHYTIRVIKFLNPNGELITLVTNEFDLPENSFSELYSMRWGIETMYKRSKSQLRIEYVSGRTVNSVMQDFWASMVLMNSVAMLENITQKNVEAKHKNSNNKNKYQVCTAKLIVALRDHGFFIFLGSYRFENIFMMAKIIGEISKCLVAVKPNRSFQRKMPQIRPKINYKSLSHL